LNKQPKIKKIDYSWVIIGLCIMMIFTCLGFCSSNRSLYLSPITQALDIKRSIFSISDSVRFVTTAVINLFFGTLIARLGVKKLIGAGFLCLICSCLLNAVASNVLVFYLAGMFLGLGLSWTTTTMVGAIVNRWCTNNRGTVMGAVLASNGLGGALAAQIVTPIIYNGEPFGYRKAYFLIAALLVTVGAVILIFMKEEPSGGSGNYTAAKKKSKGQSWIGMEPKVAFRKKWFYAAAGCIFLTGMVLQGISGIAAAHMKDVGLDADFIAATLSIGSLALTGSKLLNGIMYDKLGLRFTMTVCDVCAVITMLILAFMANSFLGHVLAWSYTIIHVIALPLETVMLPLFAADLFGEKAFNKMMGLFVSINTAGYAVGTPVVNIVFDKFGTYKPILFICAGIMVCVTIVFQFILTAAHKERDRIIKNAE